MLRYILPERIGIEGCEIIPISANRDDRGCLSEIFRQSWRGAFAAVQWNACASAAGVVRGAHVHIDYKEFYTLLRGRVLVGLADIRLGSPTFGIAEQFEWSDQDQRAIVIPPGVAHVVVFKEESLLVFGLSEYWRSEYDNVGCQWNDPALGFTWPIETACLSPRDTRSGGYNEMLHCYEERRQEWISNTSAGAQPTR